MIPRPKIVLMPIDVPPNMATVPKTLPEAELLCISCHFWSWLWSTIGRGM